MSPSNTVVITKNGIFFLPAAPTDIIFCISPIHTCDSNATWPQFEDEPVSVVASLFTLQGGREGSTVVNLFCFVYIILSKNSPPPPSTTGDARGLSK